MEATSYLQMEPGSPVYRRTRHGLGRELGRALRRMGHIEGDVLSGRDPSHHSFSKAYVYLEKAAVRSGRLGGARSGEIEYYRGWLAAFSPAAASE